METTGVTLDTDILIDLLRNAGKAVGLLAELEERRLILSTTVINAFELYHGAYRTRRREENVSATRRLLSRLVVLALSPRAAETAGRVYAELEEGGEPIGLRDALIGAISLTRGYPIVTRNVEHLRRIPGLSVMSAT